MGLEKAMTLLILLKAKKSDLLPNRFEPKRSQVEVENLAKSPVFEHRTYIPPKNNQLEI